ncbi:MAG: transporter related protein [Candidatus Saccharibacteria bacterium]|nr:transporter related protein [Candidatus Saccharibacteria bacterium]
MNRAVYKHLLETYGRLPAVWFGLVTELIRTILARVVGLIVLSQIASHVASGDVDGAKRYIWYFLIVYIVSHVVGAAGEITSITSENRLYGRLIMRYYNKLTGKDMAFYRDHQSGYLTGLFRQYLDGVLLLARFIRTDVVRTAVSLTLPAAILFYANPLLGLVAIATLAVQAVYIFWASQKMAPLRKTSHEIYRKIGGEVSDIVTNIVAFKSSGVERQARSLMSDLASEETTTYSKRRVFGIALDLPRSLFTTVGACLAFYVVVDSSSGADSVALTVLALTYMFQIIRNVNDLPNLIEHHDDYIAKAYPALEYLGDEEETVSDPPQPKELKLHSGAIELRDVTFSYPAEGREVPVFENLSIKIKGGEQVGIVGLSGAGKSTLASLLLRFDDVTSGAILIDGADIRDVRQSELRRHIAYVPQEPLLFHLTIRDNIAYFDEQATDADIERAARAAHAHEFIERLPAGYESMVGERGVKLSGGQKQRVVIARAILKNAPIMLFDEATSALDTESERIIQQALPEIIGRHTAIVIAHRLSTIAGLDRILVMHDGKIEEEGTHAELLRSGGRYSSLWKRQVEGHVSESALLD